MVGKTELKLSLLGTWLEQKLMHYLFLVVITWQCKTVVKHVIKLSSYVICMFVKHAFLIRLPIYSQCVSSNVLTTSFSDPYTNRAIPPGPLCLKASTSILALDVYSCMRRSVIEKE